MIKVKQIGNHIIVANPATGKTTEMVNVTFTEEGRKGANESLSESSDFLSRLLNVQSGLEQVRVHTQPVTLAAAAKLKEGLELPGHINRKLFSTAQMRQQIDVAPRMIDGRPTYFATELGDVVKDDVDLRLSNEALVNAQGSILFSARIGGTEVRVVEPATPMEQLIQQGTV